MSAAISIQAHTHVLALVRIRLLSDSVLLLYVRTYMFPRILFQVPAVQRQLFTSRCADKDALRRTKLGWDP